MPQLNKPILAVHDVHVSYGAITALRGCSLEVLAGEVVAVVGANGAGKTTLLKTVSNLLPIRKGTIEFLGSSTGAVAAHQFAKMGLLHIPESRGILRGQTVVENLRLSYDMADGKRSFKDALDEVFAAFPRLFERKDQKAGNMSGGEQQMLALSRAIVAPPKILLLDEPSLGLSPLMVREAYRLLKRLREMGMSILLVEQNVRAALEFANRAYVLRQGKIVQQGEASVLLADEDLFTNYLGVNH